MNLCFASRFDHSSLKEKQKKSPRSVGKFNESVNYSLAVDFVRSICFIMFISPLMGVVTSETSQSVLTGVRTRGKIGKRKKSV